MADKTCPMCHKVYNDMYMPWVYVNDRAGSSTEKRFVCPECRSVLFIE